MLLNQAIKLQFDKEKEDRYNCGVAKQSVGYDQQMDQCYVWFSHTGFEMLGVLSDNVLYDASIVVYFSQ